MIKLVKEWDNNIVDSDKSLLDALETLNKAELKILLVVDWLGILTGIVSDGDIRRGLLNGLGTKAKINEFMQKTFYSTNSEEDINLAETIMENNQIDHLPIVNEHGKVIGLFTSKNVGFENEKLNFIVIMAGGRGTRLKPYTDKCPKPLLKIAERPILEHIILNAKKRGFINFFISVNYLGYMIEEYFGNGDKLGVHIEYLREKVVLGTAGSLSLIPKKTELPIIVINGDIYSKIDLENLLEFHETRKSSATMAVRKHEVISPYGVVEAKGFDIINYHEKPSFMNLINAGVYVLNSDVLSYVVENTRYDMPEVFEILRNNGLRTLIYPLFEQWADIGSKRDYINFTEQ